MSDYTYTAGRDGKTVTVPPIDELCLILKDKFLRQEEENQRLKEENRKLKEGIWEKEEIARLKAENKRLFDDWKRGFPITERQWEKLQKWKSHYEGRHSGFIYNFVPTSLGTSGTCIGPDGDAFEFQTIS